MSIAYCTTLATWWRKAWQGERSFMVVQEKEVAIFDFFFFQAWKLSSFE